MIKLLIVICLISGCAPLAMSKTIEGYNLHKWSEAIRLAENSKTYPYGIMAKFKHTSPKQACINTILHKYRDYRNLHYKHGLKQGFLNYLGSKYAPINANNDYRRLNKYWVNNVRYYLSIV